MGGGRGIGVAWRLLVAAESWASVANGDGKANCRGEVPFIIPVKLLVNGGCMGDLSWEEDGLCRFALDGLVESSDDVGWVSSTGSEADDCTESASGSLSAEPDGVTR